MFLKLMPEYQFFKDIIAQADSSDEIESRGQSSTQYVKYRNSNANDTIGNSGDVESQRPAKVTRTAKNYGISKSDRRPKGKSIV